VVRALCLFGAHAAGVAAIDTLYAISAIRPACVRVRDRQPRWLQRQAGDSPDQVPVINECFARTAAEIAAAREVVALFASNPV